MEIKLKKLWESEFERALEVRVVLAVAEKPVSRMSLTKTELETLHALRAPSRQRSWLLGRNALKKLLSSFGMGEETSLLSFPHPHFSLTHVGDRAIAVGSRDHRLAGIGIDLEMDRLPPMKSARFFLSREEQKWLSKVKNGSQPMELLRLWTIKEAAYKANPCNQGTRLSQYIVMESPGRASGTILFPQSSGLLARYHSLKVRKGFLSLALAMENRGNKAR